METWQEHLDAVLRSWEETPFMRSQDIKGVGVDCMRFADRVLNELYGTDMPSLPRLPPGASLHNREGILMQCDTLMNRWPNDALPVDSELEPGDIVVAWPEKGPAHLFVVGVGKNEAWNASAGGVAKSSLLGWKITKVYRPQGKTSW